MSDIEDLITKSKFKQFITKPNNSWFELFKNEHIKNFKKEDCENFIFFLSLIKNKYPGKVIEYFLSNLKSLNEIIELHSFMKEEDKTFNKIIRNWFDFNSSEEIKEQLNTQSKIDFIKSKIKKSRLTPKGSVKSNLYKNILDDKITPTLNVNLKEFYQEFKTETPDNIKLTINKTEYIPINQIYSVSKRYPKYKEAFEIHMNNIAGIPASCNIIVKKQDDETLNDNCAIFALSLNIASPTSNILGKNYHKEKDHYASINDIKNRMLTNDNISLGDDFYDCVFLIGFDSHEINEDILHLATEYEDKHPSFRLILVDLKDSIAEKCINMQEYERLLVYIDKQPDINNIDFTSKFFNLF